MHIKLMSEQRELLPVGHAAPSILREMVNRADHFHPAFVHFISLHSSSASSIDVIIAPVSSQHTVSTTASRLNEPSDNLRLTRLLDIDVECGLLERGHHRLR